MVYLTLVEPILKRRLFGHSQLIQSDDDVGVSSQHALPAPDDALGHHRGVIYRCSCAGADRQLEKLKTILNLAFVCEEIALESHKYGGLN